jgi:DnaK suppressor protein
MSDVDLSAREASLRARLDELDALEAANEQGRAVVELDQQSVGRLSRMDALQNQAMAQETGRRREQERHRIAAALKRIAEDEYGWCAECGERIADKRLDIDPMAVMCAGCAR